MREHLGLLLPLTPPLSFLQEKKPSDGGCPLSLQPLSASFNRVSPSGLRGPFPVPELGELGLRDGKW